MYHWDTPIRYVKGLGPTRARELTKIGIETVGDLLERHPLSYVYPGVTNIADAKEGAVVVKAVVTNIRTLYGSTVEAILDDGTATCRAIWYHASYVAGRLYQGYQATFYGKMRGGVLTQPKWTTVPGGMDKVVGGFYGVHHDTIRAALVEALANVELPDMLNGMSRVDQFRSFHFPNTKSLQQVALRYLKFDEALQLALALQERRNKQQQIKAEVIII